MKRRGLLTGLIATPLAGCGWHALYAPNADGTPGPAQAHLAEIFVPVIPERSGQLLRQALQQRFEGADSGIPKRYNLAVAFGLAADALGIQPDSTASRIRIIGNARWTLASVATPPAILTTGATQIVDGYNILDQQYFAADIENSTVVRRIADTLADQITLQLGGYFLAHPA